MNNSTLRGMILDSKLDKYRQFKLANGEEIVCEVVQWADEEEPVVVVRKAMKVFQVERIDGYRLYTMRPWMIYCEDPQQLLTINDAMIIGECIPAKTLFKQYIFCVKEHAKNYEEELKAERRNPGSKVERPGLKDVEIKKMSDEQLGKLVRDMAEDEEESNIIEFPYTPTDKSKMH